MIKLFTNNLLSIIKRNLEISALIILILLSAVSTQIYNYNKKQIGDNYFKLLNNTYFQQSLAHILSNVEPRLNNVEHKVRPGDTINKIMLLYEIPILEIEKIRIILLKDKSIGRLKTNQILKFTIDKSNNNSLIRLVYPSSKTRKIELTKKKSGSYSKKNIITNLTRKIIFAEGKISSSLYRTATKLNVQPNVIVNFARIYGFQVDFQRDIRKNDSFQIVYEVFEDEKGKIFETGEILYSNLTLSGQNNSLYFYDKKGFEGHYDTNGKSAKKALMKTPINGARLSSPFGMRKHPIDGFNKMHRGTDFAAPEGTPIMASGDGVITRAKWCGGGGNCIKIKHNSTYSTIYAHMSKFAHGMRPGIRVKQGQIIGYVGSTGKSTGPHLHYEVIENGKKINSQTLKLPSGKVLVGNERKMFEVKRIKTDVLKSEIILGIN